MFEPTSTPTPAAPVPGAPVTVHDVARAAGVSPQTVSRVVNDVPLVRESTRQRVREAIQRLGYQRDDAASRLARGPRRARARTSTADASARP